MASGPLIKLAVFGNPVAQSRSPEIHGLFAAQCGLRVDYRAIQVTADTFAQKVRMLALEGGRGCNITAPFKNAAWQLASHDSDSARRAQAANTLVFDNDESWFADSTDGKGLLQDLQDGASVELAGSSICLLGAGGAAAGVLGALLNADPDKVVVANRSLEKAQQLELAHRDLGEVVACKPAELSSEAPFDLFINATSLGHSGHAPVLDPSWFNPEALCYDMNYGEAAEPLRRKCEEQRICYRDGLGMLVQQAALSFELWTGKMPDVAEVLEQLRDSAG